MSQFHYLASPFVLDTGGFGNNKIEIKELEIVNPNLILVNKTHEIHCHFPIAEDKSVEDIISELEVYESEEDAAGIYIYKLPKDHPIKRHFSNEFIYGVSGNFGSLLYNDTVAKVFDKNYRDDMNSSSENKFDEEFLRSCVESYKANEKCKKVLCNYIKDRLYENQYMELFSSWSDEEELERKETLDAKVYLDDIESINDLRIEDRQYVRFYLQVT